jgi:hypothetical protein
MTTLNLLPTPRAGNPGSRPNQKGGKILAGEIGKLLPTPTGTDYKSRGPNSKQIGVDNLFKGNNIDLFSLQVDFLASLSVAPGSDEAKKMTVTSGLKCLGWFPEQSRVGLLARMLLASSTWDSMTVFLTWKIKATKCKRSVFQLAPSTPRTEGIGCGFALTSSTVNMEPAEDRIEKRTAYRESIGRHYVPGGLSEQIAMLPTPTSRDHKDTGNMENVPVNALLGRELGKNRGLKLQPAFALWMMGYPEDWCDLKDGE